MLEQLNCTEKGEEDSQAVMLDQAFPSILAQDLRCILILTPASELGEIQLTQARNYFPKSLFSFSPINIICMRLP